MTPLTPQLSHDKQTVHSPPFSKHRWIVTLLGRLWMAVFALAVIGIAGDQWRVHRALMLGHKLCNGCNGCSGTCSVDAYAYFPSICQICGYDQFDPPFWWPKYVESITLDKASEKDIAAVIAASPFVAELSLSDSPISNDVLRKIGRLGHLTELKLSNLKIVDPDWQPLGGLRSLTKASISSSEFDDSGIRSISQLRFLQQLELSGVYITDAGVITLAHSGLLLNDLTLHSFIEQNLVRAGYSDDVILNLTEEHRKYAVTDDGLMELRKLRTLKRLSVTPDDGVFITQNILSRLRKAMPECHVTF